MKSVQNRLKEKILKSGLSYAELENRSGISRSSLQRYANGVTTKIPIEAIKIIAPIINTTPSYLMGWDDENIMLDGVKKESTLAISLEDNFDYYKLDLRKIVYSGIYQSYKKNNNEYYKWYHDTVFELEQFVKVIDKSIEYTIKNELPMTKVNKDYFKICSHDFKDNIQYQLDGVNSLYDYLEDLSVMEESEIVKLYNELFNPNSKKEILENEYSNYNFDNLSNKEVDKYYDRYLEVVKSEKDKFEKIIGIKKEINEKNRQSSM